MNREKRDVEIIMERSCAMGKMDRINLNYCKSYCSAVRCICFVLILAAALCSVFRVLRFKNVDGIYNFEKFYQLEDNSIDVLVLGSSHAFETFNTGYWYENYGIAGYVLGGSSQRVWNTYYYLKEALKTQSPKVIVLDAFSLAMWTEDYNGGVNLIKNAYGIKSYSVKFDSMMTSLPESEYADYFLEYVQSHSRYSELGKKDFLDDQGVAFYQNWHGFHNVVMTTPSEMPDVDGYTERVPLLAKSEEYFRKILELANGANIPILVVVAPYSNGMTPEHQMKYNTVYDISNEYGVDFINFNSSEMYKEIELDFETDFSDKEHLNYRGNVKVTKYMAEHILGMFDIPDRRDDSRYISWELEAEYINAANRNRMLTETTEIEKIKDIWGGAEYIYLVSHNGSESTDSIDDLQRYFGLEEAVRGSYIVDGVTREVLLRPEAYTWYNLEGMSFMFDWGGINIQHSRYHPENGNIDYMDSFYRYSSNGMRIVIYDKITQEIVDAFCIDINDSMNVVR